MLGSLFFNESVRSSSLVKTAIAKLGGSYIDLPGEVTEDHADVITSLAPFCDVLVLRSGEIDIESLRTRVKVPMINALCKGTEGEHTLSAVWQVCALHRLGILRQGIKVGVYGQSAHCRPYLTLQKVLALYGAEIFHDPILPELKNPDGVTRDIKQAGGSYTLARFGEFADKIDLLLIADGMPMMDSDSPLFHEYAKKFDTLEAKYLSAVRNEARINYMMPRQLADGRATVSPALDQDVRIYNDLLMEEGLWGTMALYLYMLGLEP